MRCLEVKVDRCAANGNETVFEKKTDVSIEKSEPAVRVLTEAIVLTANSLRVTVDVIYFVSISESHVCSRYPTSQFH